MKTYRLEYWIDLAHYSKDVVIREFIQASDMDEAEAVASSISERRGAVIKTIYEWEVRRHG